MNGKRGPGRPSTGLAKTGAQREAARRQRKAEALATDLAELAALRVEVVALRAEVEALRANASVSSAGDDCGAAEVLAEIIAAVGGRRSLVSVLHVADDQYLPLDIPAGLFRRAARAVGIE